MDMKSMDADSTFAEPQIYFGDWEHGNWDGLIGRAALECEFGEQLGEEVHILFAYYNYENYSGSAYVLYEQDGDLYEVVGSHCSCYGLEGQWDPDQVSPQAARLTLSGSSNYYVDGNRELVEAALSALDRYEQSRGKAQ